MEQIIFWKQAADWQVEFQKLQKSYQLKMVPVELANRVFEFIKVANIDDLLERAVDPDEIPFWADIWPSSIGLARFILENEKDFNEKGLLELGAGIGLAGIAAKVAGCRVTQSDFTAEALRFIQVNYARNHVAPSKLLLADWRQFPQNCPSFEMIIGADILYEKNLHPYLLKIFKQVLKPKGVVLLADPGRNYAKDFIKEAQENGWQSKQFQRMVFYDERNYQIDIFALTHPGNCPERDSLLIIK